MTATLSLFDLPADELVPARKPASAKRPVKLAPVELVEAPAPVVDERQAEPDVALDQVGNHGFHGPGRGVRAVTTLAVLTVALVAAVVSYEHLRALSLEAGEGWRAWLIPLSVDGLILAGSMTALANRRAGRSTGALPWLALVLGALASLGANVAAAEPTVVGRVVAAWPPVALLIGHELLLRQLRR